MSIRDYKDYKKNEKEYHKLSRYDEYIRKAKPVSCTIKDLIDSIKSLHDELRVNETTGFMVFEIDGEHHKLCETKLKFTGVTIILDGNEFGTIKDLLSVPIFSNPDKRITMLGVCVNEDNEHKMVDIRISDFWFERIEGIDRRSLKRYTYVREKKGNLVVGIICMLEFGVFTIMSLLITIADSDLLFLIISSIHSMFMLLGVYVVMEYFNRELRIDHRTNIVRYTNSLGKTNEFPVSSINKVTTPWNDKSQRTLKDNDGKTLAKLVITMNGYSEADRYLNLSEYCE